MARVVSSSMFAPLLALAANDYEFVATGQICPEMSRIQLPCGSCGPNWGDAVKCEEQCNVNDRCSHITYFEDMGCRIYSGCSLESGNSSHATVQTNIYERTNPMYLRAAG